MLGMLLFRIHSEVSHVVKVLKMPRHFTQGSSLLREGKKITNPTKNLQKHTHTCTHTPPNPTKPL